MTAEVTVTGAVGNAAIVVSGPGLGAAQLIFYDAPGGGGLAVTRVKKAAWAPPGGIVLSPADADQLGDALKAWAARRGRGVQTGSRPSTTDQA